MKKVHWNENHLENDLEKEKRLFAGANNEVKAKPKDKPKNKKKAKDEDLTKSEKIATYTKMISLILGTVLAVVLMATPFMPLITPILISGAVVSLATGLSIEGIVEKVKGSRQGKVTEKNHVFEMYSDRIIQPSKAISNLKTIDNRKEDLSKLGPDQQISYFEKNGFTLHDYLTANLQLQLSKSAEGKTLGNDISSESTKDVNKIREQIDYIAKHPEQNYLLSKASAQEMVGQTGKISYAQVGKSILKKDLQGVIEKNANASKSINETINPKYANKLEVNR